jgi:uncharacterized protein YodC (DUF2158 family)
MRFAPGNVVKHISGVGPTMVVAAIDPDGIACTWVARDGQFKTHIFSAASLLPCGDDPFSTPGPKLQSRNSVRRTGSKQIAVSKLKLRKHRPLQS